MAAILRTVGIVSHSLPPAASGQAIVLGRLLSPWPPERFCLISRQTTPGGRWRRRTLPSLLRLPAPTPSLWFAPSLLTNALWAIWRRAAQLETIAREEEIGLFVACTGDLHDLPATAWAAARLGIPFIAYVFDDYRFQWTGVNRAIAALLEPRVVKSARAIVVPNEYMKEEYRARYQVDSVVIHNPCLMPADDECVHAPRARKTIVYTGSIYHAHYDAFANLVRAIESSGRRDVTLVLYTAQSPAELAPHGIGGPRVEIHAPVAEAEAQRIACAADVLFLPLAFASPVPEVIRTSAPGKLGDYLATGRPVLAHAPRGSFVSDFLTERGCAVVVDERDRARLAAALDRLFDDEAESARIGAAGRRVAQAEFALPVMAERFGALLAECGMALA